VVRGWYVEILLILVRQRRREKTAALEAQAKGIASLSTTSKEVATQLTPEDRGNMTAGPSFVDSTTVEEIVQPTTESSFAMFDLVQELFQLDLVQDFHGELATPDDVCMRMLWSALTNLPTPIPSLPSSSPSFPLTYDGAVFDVPALHATRTFLTIATALNVMSHVYDPYYLHVLSPTIPALSHCRRTCILWLHNSPSHIILYWIYFPGRTYGKS
jgi:hypothetical protein